MKIKFDQVWLRFEPWISTLFVLVGLAIWEVAARAGKVSILFFPAPSTIFSTLFELTVSGKIFEATAATLSRLVIGFIIGSVPGLILGLTMGWLPRVRAIADPIIAALHPIPKIAIFPLIMIIFGIGEASKIVAIAISAFFPVLINSMAGVRQINPVYFEVTKNYGANPWKIFTRVILPGSLPLVLTGARLAINIAMVIGIAVELSAAKEGLGVMVWFSWQTLRTEELYASLIIIGLLGFGINQILQHLSHRLAPWYDLQTDKQY
ncbi:MAG: ABC transporter permease [Anaerolineales bacterium]|nr:ABC transporter permease [Anaerolineales bacterium]